MGIVKLKKKHRTWLWAMFSVTMFFLIAPIVLILIFDLSWWWFFGNLIFWGTGWLIFLIVFLAKRFKKQEQLVEKIDPEGAIDFLKQKVKLERDNPDNLRILWSRVWRMGIEGQETPIQVVLAYGTEKKERRTYLINLNNFKKEINEMGREVKIQELLEEANRMSEHPKDIITEETRTSFTHGMPETYFKRSLPSSQSERDKLIQKEKEEKSEI